MTDAHEQAVDPVVAMLYRTAEMIDGEWGCGHTAEQIRDGECDDDMGVFVAEGLTKLAAHDAEVRAAERERIGQGIENLDVYPFAGRSDYKVGRSDGLHDAARIARQEPDA